MVKGMRMPNVSMPQKMRWTQVGYVPTVIVGLVLALLLWLLVSLDLYRNILQWVVIAVALLLFISMMSMTVEVTPDGISWWFSLGILKRHLRFEEMSEISIRNTPVVAGFGIRTDGTDTLYAVGGSQCIELSRPSGRAILLGTSHASEIYAQAYPLFTKKKDR
jgi:hypothetical protein